MALSLEDATLKRDIAGRLAQEMLDLGAFDMHFELAKDYHRYAKVAGYPTQAPVSQAVAPRPTA